jgi:hypothetical protein
LHVRVKGRRKARPGIDRKFQYQQGATHNFENFLCNETNKN